MKLELILQSIWPKLLDSIYIKIAFRLFSTCLYLILYIVPTVLVLGLYNI